MRTTKHNFCRNCTATCGVELQVEDDKVVAHKPDPNSPFSKGFMCIKGTMAVEFMNGEEPRLTSCKKRLSNGGFEDIGPERLMDEVAAQLKRLIDEHGPQSVAFFRGTGAYMSFLTVALGKLFMDALGSPNIFTTMTIDSPSHWVVDGRMGMFKTGRPFFEDVDALCLVGSNPIVSHMVGAYAFPGTGQTKHFDQLKARGGKLIVVDPRRTETARRADVHIQPKPGFDTEIFAAINRIVIERGWYDQAFCNRYIANLETLRESVEPFTVDLVAKRAGIDGELLIEAARIISHARKPSVGFATGATMSRHPNTSAHMIEALNAMCGGFTRAGDKVRHPGIFHRRATVEGVIPPDRAWEREPKLHNGYGQLKGEFPTSQLPSAILDAGENKIRALLVVGANPMVALGQPEQTRRAFEDLELLVVMDPRMTETAELADYVVAPPLQFEIHDATMVPDWVFMTPFVQYSEPATPPPPGTIPDWKVLNGLANRLGKTLTLNPGLSVDPEAMDGGLELTPDVEWTNEKVVTWICEQAGLDVQELKANPHGLIPNIEIPTVQQPETDDGARLDLCPPDVADELARIYAESYAPNRKYALINRRMVEAINGSFRHSQVTRRRHPTNSLHMHPDDMTAEGIENEDGVRIEGDHGAIVAYVSADKTLRPGVVSMSSGWGASKVDDDPLGLRGANVCSLVSVRQADVQAIDGMPLQSCISVDLTKLNISLSEALSRAEDDREMSVAS